MSQTAKTYRLTTYSCFAGIFVQAIAGNITAILFMPLMKLYNLSYIHLGILVAINFMTQVAVDIIFSGLIDKCGFKRLVLPANIFAFIGLILFSMSPLLRGNVFAGMVISTVIFSAASGLLEIILSPIINAIPNDDKGPAMALMHSFYAWGQVCTIVITTLFLYLFGSERWQIIVLIWAAIPAIDFIMFMFSPFPNAIPEEQRLNMRDLIFNPFYIFALLAIFFGAATELVMNQWSSSFMEVVLKLPKLAGDLLGMCGFAFMLGLGRTLYGIYGSKIDMNKILIKSSLIAIVCYIAVALSPINSISLFACALCGLAASLLWPGTLVVAADKFPLAGSWMFAILAAAGDIGASAGPWLTGFIAEKSLSMQAAINFSSKLGIAPEQLGMRAGILAASVFPAIALLSHIILKRLKNT